MFYQLGWSRLAGGAVMLALAGAASAAVELTLTGPIAGNTVGPQSTSNPCVIAGTQCQQPDDPVLGTMPFNNFNQNVNDFDLTQSYLVGDLETWLGSSAFNVALDVNTTSAATEYFIFFEILVNGVQQWFWDGNGADTDGQLVANINNQGNGFADWLLSGPIDISSFADGATIEFHAEMRGLVDGAESFFLIPAQSPPPPPGEIPAPGALWLLGLGLIGLGLFSRRKRA